MSNRFRFLLVSFAALVAGQVGCSSPAQRAVVLIPPIAEPCDQARDPGCKPVYDSCETLNLKSIAIEIGLFQRAHTEVPCPTDLGNGSATVQVGYAPGEDFYMLDASYTRNMERQNITSGPFLESDREWRIVLK